MLTGCNFSNSASPAISPPTLDNESVLKYVDTLIGTKGLGNVNPSPVMPEGMIQPSPDNFDASGWDGKGSPVEYDPTHDLLSGFSLTHISGAGKGDLNDFAFLPYSGFNTEPVTIDKKNEITEVGYYSADLIETEITAELTATNRVAFQRYTYKKGQDRKLRIDLQHELLEQYGNHSRSIYYKKVSPNAIAGARTSNEWGQWQTVYFYAEFSAPIAQESIYVDGKLTGVAEAGLADYQGYGDTRPRVRDVLAHLNFGQGDDPITVKVAISGTSIDGAMANLNADDNGWDFNSVVEKNRAAWQNVLGDFKVEGKSKADKTMFYTSLYRTYIAPFLYQDVDGKYRGMDGQIHQAEPGFVNYSVYSLWDTFRASHPLKTIIHKERAIEYARDLLNKYQTGGVLPKWELHSDHTGEMVGHPAVSVIADIMVKHPEAFSQAEFELALQAADESVNFNEQKSIDGNWVPYKDAWNGDKRFTIMTRHNQYQEDLGYIPANIKWSSAESNKPAYVTGLKVDKYDELVNESVSYGLENAYYDWSIAQISKLAGNETQYLRYMKRSESFKAYFDYDPAQYNKYAGATGFMRPAYNLNGVKTWANNIQSQCLDANGKLKIPAAMDYNACKDRAKLTESDQFWPYRAEHRGEDFTEGNTWQWTWFAPHNLNGLKNIMGGQFNDRTDFTVPESVTAEGESAFLANLNALFSADSNADTSQSHDMSGYIGQFVMGNEPDHHVPYLYNWTAEPWKTQEIVHQAMYSFFHPTLEGLIGNEDVGQMSAWYVMSAMGFYQVTPGDPTYTIGRPIFDSVSFKLGDGVFSVVAENNGPDNIYVKSANINGLPLGENFSFTHQQIKAGGELRFVMTDDKTQAMKAPQ